MTTTPVTAHRSGEQGIAIVIALFMMLAMSVLGTSLMFVSKTETLSSHNYRLMSQARYGAESGIHVAANYLLSTGYGAVMPGSTGDPLSNYTLTTAPVRLAANGNPVVLSSTAASSNYPVAGVKTAFAALFSSSLDVNDAPVAYKATATLKSMRQINDAFTGAPVVIQTWEIVGDGTIKGARDATVEVSSMVERQTSPIYAYAAFATDPGCAALSFAGGATTNSYDSQAPLSGGLPVTANYSGNVGTNGNLTELGNTTVVQGSLSTPRTGVGSCSSSNVTALTQTGGATVSYGLTQLSQSINFPTPPVPSPTPPTTALGFTQNGGCPSGLGTSCTVSANGATLDAGAVGGTMTMGNITTNGSSVVHFKAGTYIVNSVTMNGNSKIVVDSGPVIFKVVGTGQTTPITITGQGLVNSSFNPNQLQFIYGGTGEVKLAGGDTTSGLFYAPNATSSITGGADLYGAIVVKQLSETGGAAIHYDRRLANSAVTAGNYMMSAFTWKNY
ncbi:MAG TPA: pilus assembly PilX N-terminal domain-containing protein [Vicinamibacterales bacterium]|nr:pilus assembly PilX N-terminal domain-containing protein [Vicinamibacterales bacterium]